MEDGYIQPACEKFKRLINNDEIYFNTDRYLAWGSKRPNARKVARVYRKSPYLVVTANRD
jgi:hypothetical protein